MSFVSRFWNAIRNPVRYVGRDLQGNKFYEAPSPNDSSRTKRTVKYYGPEDVWKYIGGGRRLAIQWSAWLTHTRINPPSIEELQADAARQQRVLANVALIEARDQAEVEERLRIRQQDAQQALADAVAESAGKTLLQKTAAHSTTTALDEAAAVTTPTLPPLDNSSAKFPSVSTPNISGEQAKFAPPTFLTPPAPRNPKAPAKFKLPPVDWTHDSSTGEDKHPSSSPITTTKEATENVKKPVPILTMPLRPVSETESWTPKAIGRG